MKRERKTNCEYLLDKRLCKAIVEDEEGRATRKEKCKNAQKDSCCYLCNDKDSCSISCNYLARPRDAAESERSAGQLEFWQYHAKYLGGHAAFANAIRGELCLYPEPDNKVVFESRRVSFEVPLSKIKNSKIITEKEILASRVFAWGIAGFAWKKKHKMILIEYEDQLKSVQSPVFEVDRIEEAAYNLYNMRVKMVPKTQTRKSS